MELSEWEANQFSLMENFHLLDSGVTGSLMNVYGPSGFPQKHAFMDFLSWVKGLTAAGNWVIGGDFNLIWKPRGK